MDSLLYLAGWVIFSGVKYYEKGTKKGGYEKTLFEL